jgi:hypothetical protein
MGVHYPLRNYIDQGTSGPANGYVYNIALSNELQNYKRPCLVSGFPGEVTNGLFYASQGSGHTWVCDGSNETNVWTGTTNTYKDAYGNITTQTTYTTLVVWYSLHMNYGNDGNGDGWFAGNNYTTSAADNENFQYFQEIITNIHPPAN